MAELLAGRYELVDRLGIRGVPDRDDDPDGGARVASADAVWRAWDHKAGTYVAAKVMQHGSAAPMLRFVRERSPRLRHRHVVAPTGWAGVGNLVLFTMPLVRGGSTAQLVAEVGPLPVQWMASLLDQLLDALASAHAVGVVHGDVRAERLLLEPNGHGAPQLRLAGFGSRLAEGDQRDDLSAVGAMAAGLLVGLGGFERVTSNHLEHSAPLGIPAVFWELLAQLTDGDLSAEQARAELVNTGCLPDDWSRVHDDAIVETVDKLPPYPAGWGPRGPIAFAAPGFVRNDLPRPLDDQPVESGGSTVSRSEPAPRSDHAMPAESLFEQEDTASREASSHSSPPDSPMRASGDSVPVTAEPELGTEATAFGGGTARHESDVVEPEDERVFVDPEDHDDADDGAESADATDSALAALFQDDDLSQNTSPSGDEAAARDATTRQPARAEGPPRPDEPESSETPDEQSEPFGPIPELELEPTPRRWFPRPGELPRLRLPGLSSLRSRLSALPGFRRSGPATAPAPDTDQPGYAPQPSPQPPAPVGPEEQSRPYQPEETATPEPAAEPAVEPQPAESPRLPRPRMAESAHHDGDEHDADHDDPRDEGRHQEHGPQDHRADRDDQHDHDRHDHDRHDHDRHDRQDDDRHVDQAEPAEDQVRSDDRYDQKDGRWRGREENESFAGAFGGAWRGSTRRRTAISSFVRLPALPALPTPGPREAESLRAMGIGGLLVGSGLVVAAFAVLLFG